MKICLMCDLHLPYIMEAIQYNVLKWACDDIKKKSAEAFLFAGDFTANGDKESADYFINNIKSLNIPSVIIPGNSDIHTAETQGYINTLASPIVTSINDVVIIAVNDSNRTVDNATFESLENADKNTIVIMHHPISALKEPYAGKFQNWRMRHPDTPLFYGHLHVSCDCGNDHGLQASDPDKAISENPCITYYDTSAHTLEKSYYVCKVPDDIYDYIGISCFYPDSDIRFAKEHRLKMIELRPNAVTYNRQMLLKEIGNWRKSGGQNLSMHAPDVIYSDGKPGDETEWDNFILLSKFLNPERITVHVPKTSVKNIEDGTNTMKQITEFLKEKISRLDPKCVIGVENMHMTTSEHSEDSRCFGYIPSEVKMFVSTLKNELPNKIGVNFDVGHARNNSPFSQKYTLGAWYSEIGNQTVGYHIHQVIQTKGVLKNHMPITNVYGKLISYASFFKLWDEGIINKAPVICEIRGHGEIGAYQSSIKMFEQLKNNEVKKHV